MSINDDRLFTGVVSAMNVELFRGSRDINSLKNESGWSWVPPKSLVFEMGAVNSELEELFQEKRRVRNPFVPIGALITAGVLTAGLISFRQGNSNLGQKLMRARVVAQGATVALMVGTAYYYGEKF
ncbi:RING-H2 finger ATL48-like [Olea europaea subsp. europaea]|uniref:RING-H2 finger ATL48-like n=2 Tax=Olea europaea subsp. europaea TaxID=158383 RepID=A0A8S0PG36_OLEEU|nr:RING-H2 finger ATL48-like [Olea europaea subsp. europaea]